jgi:rubrerythrin
MILMPEEDDIEKAVEEVDRIEDEEAARRRKEKEEYSEKETGNVVICPKCKFLVTEQDFVEDEFSEMATTSIMSKITCPKCGYVGMPVEVAREEYLKWGKKG